MIIESYKRIVNNLYDRAFPGGFATSLKTNTYARYKHATNCDSTADDYHSRFYFIDPFNLIRVQSVKICDITHSEIPVDLTCEAYFEGGDPDD